MNIDLLPKEEVLRTIEGKQFQPNPVIRLLAKILQLTGLYSRVIVTLTSQRCIVEQQAMVLWSIPATRVATVVSLNDISSIMGIKTSFLLAFKSYNMVILSGGLPLVGVNLRQMNSTRMDAEINGLSLLKQSCLGARS